MTRPVRDPSVEPVPAVSVSGLSHAFDERRALRSIDLQVPVGCLHGLVGPNGAGKSTLMKILSTLLESQSGLVQVLGMDISEDSLPIRRRVGYLAEDPVGYRQLTVFEMLDFCGAVHGRTRGERDNAIATVLETVRLEAHRDTQVGTLSRGEQRRVGIARVLVHDPELLIFDEPAAGLDPRARSELMTLMRGLSDSGRTVLVSSHVLTEIGDHCDSVTVLDRGDVCFHGPIDELPGSDDELACYQLRLEHEDEGIGRLLASHQGVVDVVSLESSAAWQVVCRTTETNFGELLATLVQHGTVVEAFVRDRNRLNEAFLSLTSGGVD
ncbi:MAG TPA: ABC transporter ATP-binding protein [Planctomycetaceae bacterium]|nr:ABC transporter ATP-binding protein [Planctomycetaceae bacterium]|tara:strand:+ start:3796 stop:4770 length:975 start_codon:yes stop_codon:yes gene_type:complete